MLTVAKTPRRSKADPPQEGSPAEQASGKRKRNAIFLTLDDVIEARLQAFLDKQRVKPDRAAVALTALIEFLDREDEVAGE